MTEYSLVLLCCRVQEGKVIPGVKSAGLLRSGVTLVILDGLSKRLVSVTMLLIVNKQKISVFNFSAVETPYVANSLMCIE